VHIPDDKRGKLDAKAIEGHFVGLPQNKKGYIVSDSRNPLRVYVSRDVTFVETPEISGRVTIQVDGQVPESEEAPMNNVEAKPESESEAEDLVVEGDDAGQKSEAGDATKTTVEDTPTQLRRSTRIKRIPVRDDDPRFSTTSYSHLKSSGDPNETENSALTMTDPTSYQDAMSRADAIYWKRACAKELEEFVRQNLFSTVDKPTGRKVVGCKWVFKTKLDEDGQIERYKARLVAQGFSQIPGVDFDKTFAPVTRHQMLQTLLGLANRYKWHIHQMDVK